MKQEVGKAAAPCTIRFKLWAGYGVNDGVYNSVLGDRLKSGEIKDIIGVPTSFQAEVLAKQYGIPLTTLDAIDHIDIAIDKMKLIRKRI